MEKPYFRAILMLKDEEFDNIYHRTRGQMSSRSQQLEADFFAGSGWEEATCRRKLHLVWAMLFGTVFMYDTGEIEYNEQTIGNLRSIIQREFDMP